MDERQIQAWCDKGTDFDIGTIVGVGSSWLASRDFDEMEAYAQWASASANVECGVSRTDYETPQTLRSSGTSGIARARYAISHGASPKMSRCRPMPRNE